MDAPHCSPYYSAHIKQVVLGRKKAVMTRLCLTIQLILLPGFLCKYKKIVSSPFFSLVSLFVSVALSLFWASSSQYQTLPPLCLSSLCNSCILFLVKNVQFINFHIIFFLFCFVGGRAAVSRSVFMFPVNDLALWVTRSCIPACRPIMADHPDDVILSHSSQMMLTLLSCSGRWTTFCKHKICPVCAYACACFLFWCLCKCKCVCSKSSWVETGKQRKTTHLTPSCWFVFSVQVHPCMQWV